MNEKEFDFWQAHSLHYLETLPSENYHCAELAVGALYLALRNFQENQRASWKKVYSRS
jgi:nitrogen fixation NifU-like protein